MAAVLILDNDPGFLSMLSDTMETTGLRVETATGGLEALEKFNRAHFDLVIKRPSRLKFFIDSLRYYAREEHRGAHPGNPDGACSPRQEC